MNSTTEPKWEQEVRLALWNRKVTRLATELRLAGWHQGMVAGMDVVTTGNGRTRAWKGYKGTILSFEGDTAHVLFELSGFGEQTMSLDEIAPRHKALCPCSICQWHREHHS